MTFSTQELALLRLSDAAETIYNGKPFRTPCKPLTGDPAKDARRLYRREWMRRHRAKLREQTSPTPPKGPTL